MVDYQLPEAIKEIQSKIDVNALYVKESPKSGFPFGLEKEPHVSVARLRNTVKLDNLKPLLCPLEQYKLELTSLSVFPNKYFDVLKCDIICKTLYDTHTVILEQYANNSCFDEFNPHITVAYLKKGKGQEYEKLAFPGPIIMEPEHFVFGHYVNDEYVREIFQ